MKTKTAWIGIVAGAVLWMGAQAVSAALIYGQDHIRLKTCAPSFRGNWNVQVSVNDRAVGTRRVYFQYQVAGGAWRSLVLSEAGTYRDGRTTYAGDTVETVAAAPNLRFRVLCLSGGNWYIDDNEREYYRVDGAAGVSAVGDRVALADLYVNGGRRGYVVTDSPDGEVYVIARTVSGATRLLRGRYPWTSNGLTWWVYETGEDLSWLYIFYRDASGDAHWDTNFGFYYRP